MQSSQVNQIRSYFLPICPSGYFFLAPVCLFIEFLGFLFFSFLSVIIPGISHYETKNNTILFIFLPELLVWQFLFLFAYYFRNSAFRAQLELDIHTSKTFILIFQHLWCLINLKAVYIHLLFKNIASTSPSEQTN